MSKYGNINHQASCYIRASMVLLLAHYQVLCYCSLAKPVLKARLWFHKIDVGLSSWMDKMRWQIVLDLSLFTLVSNSICASWSSVTAWIHNLSSNIVFSDPKF